MEDDDTLDERTLLSVDSLCYHYASMPHIFFTARGVFYKQVFGTAMGSPVSVVVANLLMVDIEEKALSTFSSPPVF